MCLFVVMLKFMLVYAFDKPATCDMMNTSEPTLSLSFKDQLESNIKFYNKTDLIYFLCAFMTWAESVEYILDDSHSITIQALVLPLQNCNCDENITELISFNLMKILAVPQNIKLFTSDSKSVAGLLNTIIHCKYHCHLILTALHNLMLDAEIVTLIGATFVHAWPSIIDKSDPWSRRVATGIMSNCMEFDNIVQVIADNENIILQKLMSLLEEEDDITQLYSIQALAKFTKKSYLSPQQRINTTMVQSILEFIVVTNNNAAIEEALEVIMNVVRSDAVVCKELTQAGAFLIMKAYTRKTLIGDCDERISSLATEIMPCIQPSDNKSIVEKQEYVINPSDGLMLFFVRKVFKGLEELMALVKKLFCARFAVCHFQ